MKIVHHYMLFIAEKFISLYMKTSIFCFFQIFFLVFSSCLSCYQLSKHDNHIMQVSFLSWNFDFMILYIFISYITWILSYTWTHMYIYISSSSSSSCRTTSTDIPDPLSPLLPIVHCFWQVFRVTSCILT